MFISGRVAITKNGVTDEKDLTDAIDVVFIRPKMDFGTRNKVVGAAAKLAQQAQQAKGGRRADRRKAKDRAGMEFDVGAYQTALLVHNILGWAGPSFRGFACTPENISAIDPDEPIVTAVLDAIADRNNQPEDDSPELDDPNVIDVTASSTTIS